MFSPISKKRTVYGWIARDPKNGGYAVVDLGELDSLGSQSLDDLRLQNRGFSVPVLPSQLSMAQFRVEVEQTMVPHN